MEGVLRAEDACEDASLAVFDEDIEDNVAVDMVVDDVEVWREALPFTVFALRVRARVRATPMESGSLRLVGDALGLGSCRDSNLAEMASDVGNIGV